ncbi:MAG: glycosyltransferase [Candidatus Thermoplasmatota archaeon]|nr:glycosyltransferase [Candidatus Thermoplasmatota archaeon]
MIKAVRKGLPVVSVVIPTLNEEKYIGNTLKAIRSQDYQGQIEIIVSDADSTDRTMEIAGKLADKTVVAEKGIARGRNTGAKGASGEILIFVDADTMLISNTVSELARAIQHDGIVGATCPIVPMGCKRGEIIFYSVLNDIVKQTIRAKDPHIPTMCVAYSKKAFEFVGGFDENMDTYEDSDLSRRIGKLGRIKFVDSTLAVTSPRRLRNWGGAAASLMRYGLYSMYYKFTGNGVKIDKYKPVR